jgi:hypothetical protein
MNLYNGMEAKLHILASLYSPLPPRRLGRPPYKSFPIHLSSSSSDAIQ